MHIRTYARTLYIPDVQNKALQIFILETKYFRENVLYKNFVI